MSSNMYTEYVFKNSDYEHAMTELQAILFNISVRNQALLRSIRSYDFSQNSEEIRRNVKLLCKQDDACSKKLLDMTFDLSEYIKKLDSYTAVYEDLKTKSMEELISSMKTRNNLEEMENEAIPYVPEADINQEEFMKSINTQNDKFLIDPATNQPYWVNPKTGESFWVDPANGKPYYVDEATGQAFYIDMDEDTNVVAQGAVQPEDALENATPVITATEEVTDVPVITAVEDVKSDEPVITSSTTISDDSEEKTTDEPVVEGEEEEVLMEYDDSLSKVVDETGAKEEAKPAEEATTTTEAKPAETPAEGEEEEVLMEYDDSLSKVVDETGATEGEKPAEEATPTTEAKPAETTTEAKPAETPAEGEEEEVLMEYDDSLSKVVDETGATEGEKPAEEATTTTEAKPAETTTEAKPAETPAEGEEEEVLMEYDDSLSKVVDETGATEEEKPAEEATTTEEAKPAEDAKPADATEETKEDTTTSDAPEEKSEEKGEEKTTDATTEEKSSVLIEPEEVDKPVEVSAEGTTDTIEVVPDGNDDNTGSEGEKVESPVDTTSAPLIPIEDTTSTTDTEETKEEAVDLNSIVPTIPDPIGLSSSEEEVTEEVAKEEESTPASDKTVFVKVNDDPPKAILTSKSQITKLRASGPTQEALLNGRGFFEGNTEVTEQDLVDNGLLAPDSDDIDAKLEKMLEQANQLYKEGKPEEAQAMYNKISEINKQRQATKELEEAEESEGYAYQMTA